jgi:hypothetical protein
LLSIFSIFARRFRDGKIEDKETRRRVAVTHLTNVDEERFARMVTTKRVDGKARADRLVAEYHEHHSICSSRI